MSNKSDSASKIDST